MNPAPTLVDSILRRVTANAAAKAAVLAAQTPASPASPAPVPKSDAPVFPSEWFQSLAKPAPAVTSSPTPKCVVTGSIRNRSPAVSSSTSRVTPASVRPLLTLPIPDLDTTTIVIVPIFSAAPEAQHLGTFSVLDHEGTSFIGLMVRVGTITLCWTPTALPTPADSPWTSLGVTMVHGPHCPEPMLSALAAGAIAVCADYELTSGFYRRTGWLIPSRWHDLLATASALNLPRDLIGLATVLGRVALQESIAGLRT